MYSTWIQFLANEYDEIMLKMRSISVKQWEELLRKNFAQQILTEKSLADGN